MNRSFWKVWSGSVAGWVLCGIVSCTVPAVCACSGGGGQDADGVSGTADLLEDVVPGQGFPGVPGGLNLVPGAAPPDVPRAAGIRVDEQKIQLVFKGDGEFVDVTVERDGAVGAVTGTVEVALDTIFWINPRPYQWKEFVLADREEVVTVRVQVAPLENLWNDQAAELGGTLIRWRVVTDAGLASGRRSAWEAHQKLEMQLWAPASVPVESANQARVRVLDLDSGTPVEGIPVSLESFSYKRENESSGVTGPDGVWSAPFESTEYPVVNLVASALQGQYVSQSSVQLQALEGTTRLLLTTDKPLYQPGQTMHMRLMALTGADNHPAANAPAEFYVVDPRGNKLTRVETTTNQFGVASGQFKLGSHVTLGKYDIIGLLGNVQTAKAVKVSRYTLPKFKVDVSLEQSWFQGGDKVAGVIHAYYLFGKPVAGGDVTVGTLEADGETPGPFQLVGKTDDEGFIQFEGELPLDIAEYLDGSDGMLYLAVTVVDAADQKQEALLPLVLTDSPVRIYLVPETEKLLDGLSNRFYLVTTDPTGRPVHSVSQVLVTGDEPIDVESDSEGVGVFDLPVDGPIEVDVISEAEGQTGQAAFLFDALKADEQAIVRSDKAVYSVGETAKLSVLSGLPEGLAYLDVHRGGQTVAMQASLLEDGQAVFEVPVGIGWDGEVVAVATLFPDDQGPQFTAQRTVFVHRHKELKVTFSTDKPLYRPGDPLKLSLSVVDESDGPLQAAVGLTVVDEALYAIQDSKPGLLWKVFEAGGRIADPVFTFAFPKTDLVGLLGEALPEPGEAFEHFQRLTAAAFAALSKLEVYSASVSNAAQQGAAAQGNAYSLTASQVGWFESQLAAMWRDEGWDSEDLVAFVLAHDWADPWGVLYQVEDTGGWVLFRSAGMDEKFGTADDISVSPSVCDIDYYACEWEVTVCDSSGYYYGSPDVAADLPSPSEDAAAEPLASGGKAVKVRKWFPETLYVDPAIITDEQGKATVEMPLADSITQWRATGLANAASGRLGSAVHGITVFQDFFVDPDLPVSYTRGDEIKFPVAVYNYLSEEQAVTVSIKQEDWFTPLGPVSQAITMPADAVDAVYFSVRIEKAGWHALTVEAFGPKAQDAVARQVQVLPGGKEECVVVSGTTEQGTSGSLVLPDTYIDGSAWGVLKLYTKGMVHVLEGVDSLLQYPYG